MWRGFRAISNLWDRASGREKERLETLIKYWDTAKAQCAGEGDISGEFLALMGVEEGWDFEWMAQHLIEYEAENAEEWPDLFGFQPVQPAAVSPQAQNGSEATLDIGKFCSYPAILIFGAPGSGKSTLAETLIHQRLKAGHRIEILDPHREAGQWEGLPCYGDGLNYAAIDARLWAFAEEVKARYTARSQKKGVKFVPLTVLAEEMTGWETQCKNSADFLTMALSDIRKINVHVLFVSHGRTLSALGGAKGMGAAKDAALLEIELLATVNDSGEATPLGKARLKFPNQPIRGVSVPNFPQRLSDASSGQFADDSQFASGKNEAYRDRFWLIALLRQHGVSDSEIVKEGLRYRGDRYGRGKAILEELDRKAREQGW